MVNKKIIECLRAGRDQAGYQSAVGLLWEKYFLRMMLLARKKLAGASPVVRDEEDIALSAFKSFCAGMQAGKYQQSDELDLWPLMVTITINKTIDHLRHQGRQKRGGGSVQQSSEIDQLLGEPDDAAMQLVADETLEKLFESLDRTGDPSLRVLATLRLEDTPAEQIAQHLGCTMRTVQRKLKTIQAVWKQLIASDP